MIDFLNNTLSFPTIFYTGLLSLVVIYWLLSIFGLNLFDSIEIDMDATDTGGGGVGDWLTKFRLNDIPLTLSISLVVFVSWIICFYLVEFFINQMMKGLNNETVRIALGFWLLLLSPALALPTVVVLLSPLRPFMKKIRTESKGVSAHDFVGKTAIVRSEKVNMTYGSVELNDGGAGLILQIRTNVPNNYQRGDQVILKQYLSSTNTYTI